MSVNTLQARAWQRTLDKLKPRLYWILGGLLVLGVSYYYYTILNRPVAGSLFFVGGAVTLYYYYVKWFVLPASPDPDFLPGDQACPDYLSLVPSDGGLYTPSSPTQYFCVDFVGVSANGALKKTTPKALSTNINDPNYRFSVDPAVDLNPPKNKRKARSSFMQRLVNAGLSWNSMGAGSTPKRNSNSNGAPAFDN
jgi:hypothetical protein